MPTQNFVLLILLLLVVTVTLLVHQRLTLNLVLKELKSQLATEKAEKDRLLNLLVSRDTMTYMALQQTTSSPNLGYSPAEYTPTGTDEAEYRQIAALRGEVLTEDDYSDDLSIAFPIGESL